MNVHIQLPADVEILRTGADSFLLLKNGTDGRFSLGAVERYLLFLLERVDTLDEVLGRFEQRFGQTLDRQQVLDFVEQLRKQGLADVPVEVTADQAPPPPIRAHTAKPSTQRLNVTFDVLALLFGWIFHPIWLIPLLAMCLLAMNVAFRHGGQIVADFKAYVESIPMAVYIVGFVWPKLFFLASLQSVLMGIVARLYGGRLSAAGIRMRYGILPYLGTEFDSSTWLMNARGRRTFISIGLWSSLAILSMCLVAWALINPDSTLRAACTLLILPCLIRLINQCNVFSRYSSAHMMLAEWLAEPLLVDVAKAELRAFLCGDPPRPGVSEMRRRWLRHFGLSAYVFSFVATAVLSLAIGYWMITRYQLIGGIFFLVGVYLWHSRRSVPAKSAAGP
jgi:hypothetical protein